MVPDNQTPKSSFAPSDSDLRMVSGAAIANYIFFDVEKPLLGDGSMRIRALPLHEVWLESTQQRLEQLAGALQISNVAKQDGVGRLCREGAGYKLVLYATPEEAGKLDQLSDGTSCTLSAVFDVEYQQFYDSPGGYSDAYGIHYWDDVRYPAVALSRFEIQPNQILTATD